MKKPYILKTEKIVALRKQQSGFESMDEYKKYESVFTLADIFRTNSDQSSWPSVQYEGVLHKPCGVRYEGEVKEFINTYFCSQIFLDFSDFSGESYGSIVNKLRDEFFVFIDLGCLNSGIELRNRLIESPLLTQKIELRVYEDGCEVIRNSRDRAKRRDEDLALEKKKWKANLAYNEEIIERLKVTGITLPAQKPANITEIIRQSTANKLTDIDIKRLAQRLLDTL